MFVSGYDVPVYQTPFPLEGFYIRTKEEVIELSKHCNFVMVNIAKSKAVQSIHRSMQFEIEDIPKALTDPKGYRTERLLQPVKPVPKRRKGRVTRLMFLLSVCLLMWQFLKV